MFRTCNVFQLRFLKSHSKARTSQRRNFGTSLGCVVIPVAGRTGVHYSHVALRSDFRVVATHEWTSWYSEVCTRLLPEYPVGDDRQKCHAQLSFRHEWDYHKAKNRIRANHTSSRSEELDRKSSKNCSPNCGLLVRKPDICGKTRNIIFIVHEF